MTIFGYIGSILIGLTLGLLGSGGSILTVPVLVYLLHYNPMVATGYSLFIVGLTSFVGASTYMRKRLVDYKTAVLFAVPSFISVYTVRRFLLPLIPDNIFSSGSFVLHKYVFIMLIFSVMMIAAGLSMIRRKTVEEEDWKKGFNYPRILQTGFIVGAITGLVSVGGGFLIIPSLVLFARVPIRLAVGTSLIIIATNALVGFAGELHNNSNVDWPFLLYFCIFSIGGIIAGGAISRKLPTTSLKPLFGWFIFLLGIYIASRELLNI